MPRLFGDQGRTSRIPWALTGNGGLKGAVRAVATTVRCRGAAYVPPQARPEAALATIRSLLREGEHRAARRLAAEAATRFPGDEEIRNAARVLGDLLGQILDKALKCRWRGEADLRRDGQAGDVVSPLLGEHRDVLEHSSGDAASGGQP